MFDRENRVLDKEIAMDDRAQEMTMADVMSPEERNPAARQALAAGWPWPLAKALFDDFNYDIGLRDGSIVHFTRAHVRGTLDWVTLDAEGLLVAGPMLSRSEFLVDMERGLVIRVSEIVWAVDGPS